MIFSKKNLMVYFTLLICTAAQAKDYTVALTILAEARGEGEIGQSAVMAVIVQRSLERNLSMKDVCLERKQFSCWNGKTYKQLLPLLKTKQAKFAIWLQDHAHLVDLTAMKYANHYHAEYVSPYWSKGKKPLYKIQNHIFYRL
jgi:spore germination cell wall hydrolase CwlJ-like protein